MEPLALLLYLGLSAFLLSSIGIVVTVSLSLSLFSLSLSLSLSLSHTHTHTTTTTTTTITVASKMSTAGTVPSPASASTACRTLSRMMLVMMLQYVSNLTLALLTHCCMLSPDDVAVYQQSCAGSVHTLLHAVASLHIICRFFSSPFLLLPLSAAFFGCPGSFSEVCTLRTRLLQDALGGRCKTVIIATISPAGHPLVQGQGIWRGLPFTTTALSIVTHTPEARSFRSMEVSS